MEFIKLKNEKNICEVRKFRLPEAKRFKAGSQTNNVRLLFVPLFYRCVYLFSLMLNLQASTHSYKLPFYYAAIFKKNSVYAPISSINLILDYICTSSFELRRTGSK